MHFEGEKTLQRSKVKSHPDPAANIQVGVGGNLQSRCYLSKKLKSGKHETKAKIAAYPGRHLVIP